jgi:hypothetical protein
LAAVLAARQREQEAKVQAPKVWAEMWKELKILVFYGIYFILAITSGAPARANFLIIAMS